MGIIVLLTGVVAMHVGVLAPGHAHGAEATHAEETHAEAHDHSVAMTDGDKAALAASDPCPDGACSSGHSMLHACVFVLSAAALMLVLTLLYWIGMDRIRRVLPTNVRYHARRRERSPPWTVLSLAELSILRI